MLDPGERAAMERLNRSARRRVAGARAMLWIYSAVLVAAIATIVYLAATRR